MLVMLQFVLYDVDVVAVMGTWSTAGAACSDNLVKFLIGEDDDDDDEVMMMMMTMGITGYGRR